MLKPLGSLLPEALGRLRVRKPVEASVICRAADEALSSYWDHAVPMRAISYQAGVVYVAVTSPAWGHEVSTRAEPIKDNINAKLTGAPVRAIKTKVSPTAARGETGLG